jgi:hypothetical protein
VAYRLPAIKLEAEGNLQRPKMKIWRSWKEEAAALASMPVR